MLWKGGGRAVVVVPEGEGESGCWVGVGMVFGRFVWCVGVRWRTKLRVGCFGAGFWERQSPSGMTRG